MDNGTTQMANAADAFLLAADRCMEERLVNGSCQMLVVPSVVNLALSVEIYMKCLFRINETKIPKTHSLEKMFTTLPENVKREIAEKMGVNISELGCKILKMSDIFIIWRYIYEQSSAQVDIKFLADLARAMQHIVTSGQA